MSEELEQCKRVISQLTENEIVLYEEFEVRFEY